MLDYAANAVLYWPPDRIRIQLEEVAERSGREATEVLAEFLGDDADLDEFWSDVEQNLRSGRVRRVFLA